MQLLNKPSFTFAITVCDEFFEFERLLQNIISQMTEFDEILIIKDVSKGDETEFRKICCKYLENTFISYTFIAKFLNKDFATFKNNIVTHSRKDFIIQIDADETLSENFVTYLRQIIELNPNIDCYAVARVNYVSNITQEYLKQMSWYMDEKSRINFPDRQFRIFKNNKKIFWKNSVHEVLYGWKNMSNLPDMLFLLHEKTFDKQLSQNEFYASHF